MHEEFSIPLEMSDVHIFARSLTLDNLDMSTLSAHIWECEFCGDSSDVHSRMSEIHDLNADLSANNRVAFSKGIYSAKEVRDAKSEVMRLSTEIHVKSVAAVREIKEIHELGIAEESLLHAGFSLAEIAEEKAPEFSDEDIDALINLLFTRNWEDEDE